MKTLVSIFSKSIILSLMLALLFFCRGGSVSVTSTLLFGTSGHSGMISHHTTTNSQMPCCDVESPLSTTAHDVVIAGSTQSRDNLATFILFASAVFFYFSYRLLSKEANFVETFSYIRWRRLRWGDFGQLNIFSSLFKKGILHPKTW